MSEQIKFQPTESATAPDVEINSQGLEAEMLNHTDAARFLEVLEPVGNFTFVTFDDKKSQTSLTENLHGQFNDYVTELSAANLLGAGVFVTVNETDLKGRKTENIQRVRAVFVDLDGADLKPVLAWEHSPHMVVESSPGKWHAYWLVTDLDLAQFKTVQQTLAMKFGGDRKVCDLPRLMRVPGFFHHKDEPVLSRLHSVHESLVPYAGEKIKSALLLNFDQEILKPVVTSSRLPANASVINAGERNTKLTSIGGGFRRQGMAESDLQSALLGVNSERCQPPLDATEVMGIAKSVARYAIPDIDLRETLNDAGNASRFVAQHGTNLRFISASGQWLIWQNENWDADQTSQCMEMAKETAHSIYAEASATNIAHEMRTALAKHAGNSLNMNRLNAMLRLASSDRVVTVLPRELDGDDMLLGVENGVVDLRSGEFRLMAREDLITIRCGTSYEETARCPTFEAFLKRVMGGDEEMVAFLQRLVGYSLTGRTNEHAFAFLYGVGANGKSTFLDVLMNLLGNYAAQAQPETFMARRSGGSATGDLARLVGKRVVVSNEVREGGCLEENLVKQLVGGDVMTARFMYGSDFEFRPKLKLFISGNHHPVIKGDDMGIWRRVMLIPFTQTIPEPERDKHLGSKLVAELPGILNWAIAGCLAWQREGLKRPSAILEATRLYRAEMDMFQLWVDEECCTGAALTVRSKLLYENYRKWCEAGSIKPLSIMAFGRKMEGRGFSKSHTRMGNVFEGINLNAKGGVT